MSRVDGGVGAGRVDGMGFPETETGSEIRTQLPGSGAPEQIVTAPANVPASRPQNAPPATAGGRTSLTPLKSMRSLASMLAQAQEQVALSRSLPVSRHSCKPVEGKAKHSLSVYSGKCFSTTLLSSEQACGQGTASLLQRSRR